MARVRIIDRDKGWKALLRRTKKLARQRGVTVGIHDGEGSAPSGDSALSVADVATIHEFGLGDNPERSFVRAYADEHADEVKAKERELIKGAIKGNRTADDVLELLGLWIVSKMQERVRSGISPPNDPVTIAAKGSSTPLINFGQLVSSITHEVE